MTRTMLSDARYLVAFAEDAPDDTSGSGDLVIPEDVSTLSDEELAEAQTKAVEGFDVLYGEGDALDSDTLTALEALTEGIERLNAEAEARAAAAEERKTKAAELAKRAKKDMVEAAEDGEDDEEDSDDEDEMSSDDEALTDDEIDEIEAEDRGEVVPDKVAASGRKEVRVSLSGLPRRSQPKPKPATQRSMKDVMLAAGDGTGVAPGTGLDWPGVARIVDRRLQGFPEAAYAAAAQAGRSMRQQFSVATLSKPIPDDLVIRSSDVNEVDSVLQRARDEKRLKGGSLVASGGWVAPSENVYDLCELESRDGIIGLPEVGVARGGVNYTAGPDFKTIFADSGVRFSYTEAEDIAGDYDGAGGGSKPCYSIGDTSFTDVRLTADGVCISAGLLAQRGYPELIARTTRGVLVAHDHKHAEAVITAMVAASDAVTGTAGQAGAVAPLLEIIELQVEHYRYVNRLSRSATLEAVFPFWVRGVLRADLSRRNGVDLFSVSDAQIDGWFTQRGIAPQYVYNWQDLTGGAGTVVTWPATVTFLLYAAGTFVKGVADVITLDTIYDSVNLGTNDFTALFTEEAWLLMKTCHDARAITVALEPSGNAGGSLKLAADGTIAV